MEKIYELYEGVNINEDPFDPTETNDFLCYKRIDYQDILNELKKSIVDR